MMDLASMGNGFEALGAEFAKHTDEEIAKLGAQPGALFNRRGPNTTAFEGEDGVISYGGYILSEESDKDLATPRGKFTAFANMINDSTTVSAAVRYMVGLCSGTRWTVSKKDGSGSDGEKARKIVEEGIFEAKTQQPWSTTIGQAALSPLYGFSLHEWYQRRRNDGLIVLGDIQSLPQWTIQRWDKGDDGTKPVQGIEQWVPGMPMNGPSYVNRQSMLYVADRSLTNKPDGIGLLRHVYKKWKILERYELLEGFGFEGDLRGIPSGMAPYEELNAAALIKHPNNPDAVRAYVSAQTKVLRDFIQNHVKTPGLGILLDSQRFKDIIGNPTAYAKWGLSIMKGDGSGLEEIAKTIDRLVREIARVLGVDFLMLGVDGKGSLALSQDKTSMFASLLASALGNIAWSITYDLAWPLITRNGLDPEKCCPDILPDPISSDDVEKVTRALLDMAQAGAPLMAGDPAIDQVRQRLHLAEQPTLAPELMGALQRTHVGLPAQKPDPNAPPPPQQGGMFGRPTPGQATGNSNAPGQGQSQPPGGEGAGTNAPPAKGDMPASKPTGQPDDDAPDGSGT